MKRMLLIAALSVATMFNANAYDFSAVTPSGHTLYYNIVNGHAEVVRPYASTGTNSYVSGALIIPASVVYNGVSYPVTKLSSLRSDGDGAFQDCNMTSVVIPSSITEIGFAAFHQCDSLTSIIVPATVSTIGESAFSYCDNLRSIYFRAQNPPLIDWSTFSNTPSDKVFYVPNQYYQNYTSAWNYYVMYLSWDIVSYDPLQFDITINPNNSTMGAGIYSALGDSIVEITAVANYGYHFDHWSYGSSANPDTLYLTEDVTVTAYFAINQYSVTGTTNDSVYGTVTGGATVNYLDTVMLTAVPNTGYHFVRWSDYTIDNPKTVVATSDITKTAYFAPNEYTINISVDSFTHGTCTGDGTYQYATVATLEAVPYSGYQFSHWIDGATYNPYTFAVTDDVQLTAYFYADGTPYQDTIVVYDTLLVIMPVHDTTVVHVFDTTYIDVHDTTFIPIHDTTYVNVHDTTYIGVPYTVHDTLFVNIHDTVRITDTLWLTQTDTLWLHDTITIHDTVHITQEGIDGVDALNAKVYTSQGQIVVEGADGKAVALFDINGRMLATKQDYGTVIRFDAPASGTFMIKIGNHAARKVVVIR